MNYPLPEWQYVCDECASDYGARMIDDIQPTMHAGSCDICERDRVLAHVSDYIWPHRKLMSWD